MSVANAIQKGDFDLNLVSIRKPLEFADGTIQDTAYTGGGGIPTLEEVLLSGDDAQGNDIIGVSTLDADAVVVNTQLQLIPAGNTVNVLGEINQIAVGLGFVGNQLQPTLIDTQQGSSTAIGLQVVDNTNTQGLYVLPNAQNNIYNPIVNANDVLVVANSTTQSLAITCDSATTTGIRVSDTQMVLGVGGNADTPSQNIIFNNPANTIKATTTTGFYASSSTIEPNPTLAVQDVPSGQAMYFIPKANAGNYNPICQANNQQIVAWGSAGVNTQTIELVPHSGTACGIKLAPTTCEIGAGGGGADPSNRITFAGTGTLEYGNSHQFVNGVAQYDTAGQAGKIVPSAPSTASNIVPSFEILTYHLTGNSGTPSATMTLQHNNTATTNYAVFPSVYYGYTGSGGTHNASATSNAIDTIVITNITSTQFSWIFTNNATGDNFNIYMTFLIVYQMPNTDYPKVYS